MITDFYRFIPDAFSSFPSSLVVSSALCVLSLLTVVSILLHGTKKHARHSKCGNSNNQKSFEHIINDPKLQSKEKKNDYERNQLGLSMDLPPKYHIINNIYFLDYRSGIAPYLLIFFRYKMQWWNISDNKAYTRSLILILYQNIFRTLANEIKCY